AGVFEHAAPVHAHTANPHAAHTCQQRMSLVMLATQDRHRHDPRPTSHPIDPVALADSVRVRPILRVLLHHRAKHTIRPQLKKTTDTRVREPPHTISETHRLAHMTHPIASRTQLITHRKPASDIRYHRDQDRKSTRL